MNWKGFLKTFGVAMAGTAVNQVMPIAMQVPSKYTPLITMGLMGAAHYMQSPKQGDQERMLLELQLAQATLIQNLQNKLAQLQAGYGQTVSESTGALEGKKEN